MITADLDIDGIEELKQAIARDLNMLAKMASVQRMMNTYPKYQESMTMEKLVPFIRKHPEWGIELSSAGPDAHLIFTNDPQHRFKILKLLDDDHLKSELTEFEYEANSKSSPTAGTG